MLLASRVIIFVHEVLCIFWHYIKVDEVSLITLKKLLQSAMDCYYKLRQLFYYKLRQVLQSAMIITNCDSTVVLCFDRLKNRSKFRSRLTRFIKQ